MADMDQSELRCTIKVDVETVYLPNQSSPADRRFVFAYRITIRNVGETPTQLLTRSWLITDADGKVQEVRGDGVVGVQPHLPPGSQHSYSSGAVLETPVGTMEGSYGMLTNEGTHFDASIPLFRLAVPGVLH
jgi:ApaG protein